MTYKIRAIIDPIRTTAFGAIGANYTAVGAILDEPTRIFYLFNGTDQDIYFSDDGVNNKFRLPTGGFIVMDITSNKVRDDGFFMPEQRYWYVKHAGAAPTSGSIDITIIHA